VVGLDLVAHGTTSDQATITDTAIAQPLIVAAGIVAAEAMFDAALSDLPVVLAGHSVGEITASALAGVLTAEDAMRFVGVRAQGMAKAAAVTPTGMSAIVGGDRDEVLAAISAAGADPANVNGGGQIVAAGTFEQLQALADNPPAKARVIPLKVAGAFHTRHMSSALADLEALRATLTVHDPNVPLLSNYDGAAVSSGAAMLESLVAQVSRPVRWDLCMETLTAQGVTGVIELTPAGTLVGLAKRGMPGVKTVSVKTPADVDDAVKLFAADAGEDDATSSKETV
jgi:[acyl-carrier-protein] S-malonyltransferase